MSWYRPGRSHEFSRGFVIAYVVMALAVLGGFYLQRVESRRIDAANASRLAADCRAAVAIRVDLRRAAVATRAELSPADRAGPVGVLADQLLRTLPTETCSGGRLVLSTSGSRP